MILSKVTQVFQGIVGILFIGFGLLYLLQPTLSIDITGWIFGGIIAVGALIRLIIICLPASQSFPGNAGLEIAGGTCEALFGVFFVLNAALYLDLIYPLIAALLFVMAMLRIVQSGLIKKQRQNGWGSYLFMAVLFLLIAAGLIVSSYVVKIDLQIQMVGAAAFIYGFFLIFSAAFKKGFAEPDDKAGPEQGGDTKLEEEMSISNN